MFHRVKLGWKQATDKLSSGSGGSDALATDSQYAATQETFESLERHSAEVRKALANNEGAWRAVSANIESLTGSVVPLYEDTHPFHDTAVRAHNAARNLQDHLRDVGVMRQGAGGGDSSSSSGSSSSSSSSGRGASPNTANAATGGGDAASDDTGRRNMTAILGLLNEYTEKCKEMRKRGKLYESAAENVKYYMGKVDKLSAKNSGNFEENNAKSEMKHGRNEQKLHDAQRDADEKLQSFQRGVNALQRNKNVVFSRTLVVFLTSQINALNFAQFKQLEDEIWHKYRDMVASSSSATSNVHLDWSEVDEDEDDDDAAAAAAAQQGVANMGVSGGDGKAGDK